jgi:signal transduction histidine kinase
MEAMYLGLAWVLKWRIRRGQEERERLLLRSVDASNVERRRIAADLHDGVVQELVGTSFVVSAAAEAAVLYGPELARDLHTAAMSTRRSLQSLRSLLVDIYPPNLHDQGLEAALLDLLAPATSLGIETELAVEGDPDQQLEATTLAYRVAQEAVRNVLRHADASTLDIGVNASGSELVVSVRDDGKGFTARRSASSGHFGLRLLADLTADAGARFSVDSTPGVGTAIRLEVPT